MHSSLVRTQNVFGYFTTVAFVTAACVALSVLLSPQVPSATIQLRNVQVVKGRPHYYSTKKEDYAHIKFDLDADLSSLFNWNTKQVFAWITATYPSSSRNEPPSQAIIWDSIISSYSQLHPYTPFDAYNELMSSKKSNTDRKTGSASKKKLAEPDPKPGIVHLKNSKQKYQITDISGKLASQKNVTLELGWNVQPWVGALTWTTPEGGGFGRWKGVRGGRSPSFDLPALKGKSSGQEQVVEKGTPKPAEASAVI
ncbi:MAG: hypothetical protein Q9191_002981 [Dirinaria sp. TL-2023a]